MNTVDRLLLGSKKLNELSSEIELIVKAVAGPLKREAFETFEIRVSHDIFWKVIWCPGEKPLVACIEEWEEGEGGGSEVAMYEMGKPTHAWYVKRVHDVLNPFVEAMMKRFPVALNAALGPVIKASWYP